MPPSTAPNSQGHYITAYDGGQGFNANAKHSSHSLHRRTAGERVSDITRLLQVKEGKAKKIQVRFDAKPYIFNAVICHDCEGMYSRARL